MWTIQKLYENRTGNQCTVTNISINALQMKKKKCQGEGVGNEHKFSMLRIEHGGQCVIMFDLVSSESS